MSETTVNVLSQPVSPILQTANQKIQEAFAPLFKLMQHDDFRHAVEFTNAYPYPEVEFTDDNCGIVIKHLPTDYTRELMEDSPIMDICHQLKHLYNDGDRVGKTGIKQKKQKGHQLENNNLRICISYAHIVSVTPNGGKEATIRFYIDQSKNNLPRVKESFKRTDVSDTELNELKESGRLICHNRSKVIAWRYLSEEEQQELLSIVLTTCSEEIKQHIRDAYSSAYINRTIPNFLVTPPPQQQ